jgi:RNA recognition motif-containing protein
MLFLKRAKPLKRTLKSSRPKRSVITCWWLTFSVQTALTLRRRLKNRRKRKSEKKVGFRNCRNNFLKESNGAIILSIEDMRRLHVSGFDKNAKEDEIKSLFPKCIDFFMPRKRDSEINLKFAFVQFKKDKHAKEALDEVKEATINGKKLVIDYACVKNTDKKTTIKKDE